MNLFSIAALAVSVQSAPKPDYRAELPPGSSELAYRLIERIQEQTAEGNQKTALQIAARLPSNRLTYSWDDSALTDAQKRDAQRAMDEVSKTLQTILYNFTIERAEKGLIHVEWVEKVQEGGEDTWKPQVIFTSTALDEPVVEAVISFQTAGGIGRSQRQLEDSLYSAAKEFFLLNPELIYRNVDPAVQVNLPINQFEVAFIRNSLVIGDSIRAALQNEQKIVIDRPEPVLDVRALELGSARQGDSLWFEIQVTNLGKGALQSRVRPDCGCLLVTDALRVEPGGTFVLAGQLDTVEFVGSLTKNIEFLTNDPGRPFLSVDVMAQVEPLFRLLGIPQRPIVVEAPGAVHEIFFEPQQGESIEVTAASLAGSPAEVTVTAGERELDDPLMGEPSKSRKGYIIQIRFTEEPFVPRSVVTLNLATSHPRFRTLATNFMVQQSMFVEPVSAFWGRISSPSELRITLESPGQPISITKIEIPNTSFRAKDLSSAPAERHQIVLEYLGDGVPGPVQETIRIHTSNPKRPIVEVPMSAIIE
ncbi:MAG: hypothetical protein ACK4P3_00125 [Fimbriimonadaceae bacterium]